MLEFGVFEIEPSSRAEEKFGSRTTMLQSFAVSTGFDSRLSARSGSNGATNGRLADRRSWGRAAMPQCSVGPAPRRLMMGKIAWLRGIVAKLSLIMLSVFAAMPLTGCHKNALFNTGEAEHFFPLAPGSTWTYLIIDRNGGRETFHTLKDRVLITRPDVPNIVGEVLSEFVDRDRWRWHQFTMLYLVQGDYLSRASASDTSGHSLSTESRFLPRRLTPDMTWSNMLTPFDGIARQLDSSQFPRR
jgi:hypothetical protein